MEIAPNDLPASRRPVDPGPFGAGGGPRPTKERIVVLDAVRGLALFGILVVNAPLYFWPVQAIALGGIPAPNLFDAGANALVRFAFEGKFFTIFSLLFGIGVALQLSRGHRPRVVVRRLLLLALFGALHISLLRRAPRPSASRSARTPPRRPPRSSPSPSRSPPRSSGRRSTTGCSAPSTSR